MVFQGHDPVIVTSGGFSADFMQTPELPCRSSHGERWLLHRRRIEDICGRGRRPSGHGGVACVHRHSRAPPRSQARRETSLWSRRFLALAAGWSRKGSRFGKELGRREYVTGRRGNNRGTSRSSRSFRLRPTPRRGPSSEVMGGCVERKLPSLMRIRICSRSPVCSDLGYL